MKLIPGITETAVLKQMLEKIRPFTMVPEPSLIELARQVRAILEFRIPGDLVECGVWRGGAAFLMADLLRQAEVRDRKVWLFDSFEGLPAPEKVDGPAALAYPKSNRTDNCRASIDEVQRNAARFGLSDYTRFVKGWFDQTLPVARQEIGPIALLRIDGDWYSSVRCCLESLYEQVAEDGFIIIDDYYAWDGCTMAVHEFLAKKQLVHRLESIGGTGSDSYCGAVFRKGKTTWRDSWKRMEWLDKLKRVSQEIASFMPAGKPFILIDDDQIRGLIDNREAIPFLENQGKYGGPPANDEMALQEIERRQEAGVGFIVIGWPAFWWLEHYTGFNRFLRNNFRCLVENEHMIVFDLREESHSTGSASWSGVQP